MLPAVHSIVDVVRVLHQSACKLPKAEIRILNQIELLAFILSVILSDKSFSHFIFSPPHGLCVHSVVPDKRSCGRRGPVH